VRREGDLRVRGTGGRWRRAPGVLVAADAPHEVDAAGGLVVVLFVEPESDDGARMRAALAGPLTLLDAERREALFRPLGGAPFTRAAAARWMSDALALLSGGASAPRAVHPRVRRVLRHLRDLPPGADTSLDALAVVAGLSPGRLMHAFTESVGVPLRRYLMWLRLQRAGGAIAAGRPIGEAAHLAGFADAAHLTRTFRRMFGVAPAAARDRSQIVQDGAR
jgi:AraC-like DNA-binding protein